MKSNLIAAALIVGAIWTGPVQAGRSCEQEMPSLQGITRSLDLADKVRAALDASGADVVVLARAGQDLRKYGLQYSHLGFAYREQTPGGGKAWRVLHKLNHCGTADSAMYRQGLGEFFLDDLWRYEAAWIEPTPEVQRKLLALLRNPDHAIAMHHKPYSIVSYAWDRRYQQSNQWAIETLASAMQASPPLTRSQAQDWLMQNGYRPSTLTIGPLTRMGGRLTAASVTFEDHPPHKRFSDRIETVTVDSVFEWLQRSGLGGSPVILRLD